MVRSQLFCHIFGWLILTTSDDMLIDQQAFQLVKVTLPSFHPSCVTVLLISSLVPNSLL